MWIPPSVNPEIPSTEQSDSRIAEKSFSEPSTIAATQSCLRPSISITISPAVTPAAYSLVEPSGKVTEIMDMGVPPPPTGALLHFTLVLKETNSRRSVYCSEKARLPFNFKIVTLFR